MNSFRGTAWPRLRCIVTALLATLLIACSGIALAEDPEESTAQDSASEPAVELEGKRTATSQTFRLPDGSRETRIFEAPINYRDADGTWQPIEEGFEPDGASLTNGESDFDVDLPNLIGAGAVRISFDDLWISQQLLGEQTEPVDLDE